MDTINETEIKNDEIKSDSSVLNNDNGLIKSQKKINYFWPVCVVLFHIVMGFLLFLAYGILLVMGFTFRSKIVGPCVIWIMLGIYIPLIYIWIKRNGICKGLGTVLHIISGVILFAIAPFVIAIAVMFFTVLDYPQHVVEIDGHTYVAEVHTWLDTCVYYYDYHGEIIMGSKKKMLGVFYGADLDPYANGPEPTAGKAYFSIYDKFGEVIEEKEVSYE